MPGSTSHLSTTSKSGVSLLASAPNKLDDCSSSLATHKSDDSSCSSAINSYDNIQCLSAASKPDASLLSSATNKSQLGIITEEEEFIISDDWVMLNVTISTTSEDSISIADDKNDFCNNNYINATVSNIANTVPGAITKEENEDSEDCITIRVTDTAQTTIADRISSSTNIKNRCLNSHQKEISIFNTISEIDMNVGEEEKNPDDDYNGTFFLFDTCSIEEMQKDTGPVNHSDLPVIYTEIDTNEMTNSNILKLERIRISGDIENNSENEKLCNEIELFNYTAKIYSDNIREDSKIDEVDETKSVQQIKQAKKHDFSDLELGTSAVEQVHHLSTPSQEIDYPTEHVAKSSIMTNNNKTQSLSDHDPICDKNECNTAKVNLPSTYNEVSEKLNARTSIRIAEKSKVKSSSQQTSNKTVKRNI